MRILISSSDEVCGERHCIAQENPISVMWSLGPGCESAVVDIDVGVEETQAFARRRSAWSVVLRSVVSETSIVSMMLRMMEGLLRACRVDSEVLLAVARVLMAEGLDVCDEARERAWRLSSISWVVASVIVLVSEILSCEAVLV